MRPGFKREELRFRYDVPAMSEDGWHRYSGLRTACIINKYLPDSARLSNWLLNAGSGVYSVAGCRWAEVSLDLFRSPIKNHPCGVCGNIEQLPFRSSVFGAVVCVGEVLAYCDPAIVIREFSRVLKHNGILICDFGSSKSPRYWFKQPYAKAADLVIDSYNGTPERTWIYDPNYIVSLLGTAGFILQAQMGTHTWSAFGRRLGFSHRAALSIQYRLEWLRLPACWADVTTIVAKRAAIET